MAGNCSKGGNHVGGPVQREGKASVIRCTKCGTIISKAELPDD